MQSMNIIKYLTRICLVQKFKIYWHGFKSEIIDYTNLDLTRKRWIYQENVLSWIILKLNNEDPIKNM